MLNCCCCCWNVVAAGTVLLFATTTNIVTVAIARTVVTTVAERRWAGYGRATDRAAEVHMGQALHFRPQQWTCGAHLRAGGASGPGEAPGEPLIAPWSLIRQPPLRFICMLVHRKSWRNPYCAPLEGYSQIHQNPLIESWFFTIHQNNEIFYPQSPCNFTDWTLPIGVFSSLHR